MNDIIISAKRLKTEGYTLFVCFLISFLSNIGAILYYQSPFSEIITSMGYIILFALFIYAVWSSIRGLKMVVLSILKK